MEEEWLMSSSKQLMNSGSDIYAARCWLIAAKSLCPDSFKLQFEEYNFEMRHKNVEECSKLLSDMFSYFPAVRHLWEEIEKLIQAVDKEKSVRNEIFNCLPAATQQRMIIGLAEASPDITQYSELILLLMKRFPESIQQYGVPLTERLMESEKRDDSGVLNECRRLLVCKALPIICKCPNVDLSHRQYFKFMQRSTEFYACSFTSDNGSYVETSWEDLEALGQSISDRCGWDSSLNGAKESTLSQRMTFIRELYSRSRSDSEEKVNRKQIFYTTIILLLEATSKYILLLDSSIFRDSKKEEQGYIFLDDCSDDGDSSPTNITQNVKLATEINEHFQIAKESWLILHSNETFEKDFNHLLRRWKCDRWFWFQLFLVDMNMYEKETDEALSRLQNMEAKFNDTTVRPAVERHIYCRLSSVMFNLAQYEMSCMFAFRCLPLVGPAVESSHRSGKVSRYCPLRASDGTVATNMVFKQLSVHSLMPFFINTLVKSLRSLHSNEDDVLGHIMVLGQHDWPKWKSEVDRVMERIKNKAAFTYKYFQNYVINFSILEEIAFIHNKGATELNLFKVKTEVAHVTRSVSGNDLVWKLLEGNIQRSEEPIDDVIRSYLTSCEDSIMSCLNSNNGS